MRACSTRFTSGGTWSWGSSLGVPADTSSSETPLGMALSSIVRGGEPDPLTWQEGGRGTAAAGAAGGVRLLGREPRGRERLEGRGDGRDGRQRGVGRAGGGRRPVRGGGDARGGTRREIGVACDGAPARRTGGDGQQQEHQAVAPTARETHRERIPMKWPPGRQGAAGAAGARQGVAPQGAGVARWYPRNGTLIQEPGFKKRGIASECRQPHK